MARPLEIDGKLVVKLRSLPVPVPWEQIAFALGASRSGVIQAYRREKGSAGVSSPTCGRCGAALVCDNEGCDEA